MKSEIITCKDETKQSIFAKAFKQQIQSNFYQKTSMIKTTLKTGVSAPSHTCKYFSLLTLSIICPLFHFLFLSLVYYTATFFQHFPVVIVRVHEESGPPRIIDQRYSQIGYCYKVLGVNPFYVILFYIKISQKAIFCYNKLLQSRKIGFGSLEIDIYYLGRVLSMKRGGRFKTAIFLFLRIMGFLLLHNSTGILISFKINRFFSLTNDVSTEILLSLISAAQHILEGFFTLF